MSSTSSTPDSSSSSTPEPSPTPGNGNTSSNLYLFTFLATLFLLLAISCSIVLRSFLLRRRYQRRLAEALEQGIILAPRTPGSRKKRFGAKPKFYEHWLSGGGDSWDEIMPVAAQPLKTKYRSRSSKNSSDKHDDSHDHPQQPPSWLRRQLFWNIDVYNFHPSPRSPRREQPLSELTPPSPPRSPSPHTDAEKAPPTKTRPGLLQVSVLVAMPSPHRSRHYSPQFNVKPDDASIPAVEFGVTRLLYKTEQETEEE